MTEAVFFTTKRNGKIALWVEVPGEDGIPRHNLGDVDPKECTERLLSIAKYAFQRGNEFSQIQQQRQDTYISVSDNGWPMRVGP